MMSDIFREHRPLLREDISDEESQSFTPPLRRHMGYKGKARNTVKGAAAIIKNWPDYWSSSITYWWIGIGMFALMTFILYNSVVAYSLLPAADSSPIPQYFIEKKMALPEIFMHLLVNNEKEADLNKYLPYVQIFADKYLHYTFNLIIILNDTGRNEQAIHQSQINNENAMNSLWTENRVHETNGVPISKSKSNINIQYVNLSNYLEESPLRQFWKQLPFQLIEFLVRAVSIWDKGGVAFSPIILTPRSPDAIYIEKLYSLLSSYAENKKLNITTDTYKTKDREKNRIMNNHKRKYKKKVNNIRDVIDALEMDKSDYEKVPEVLTEAENKQENTRLEIQPLQTDKAVANNSDNFNVTGKLMKEHIHKHSNSIKNNGSEIFKYKMPSFLGFLFHDKPFTTSQEDSTDSNSIKRTSRAVSIVSTQENIITDKVIQPMIISAPTNFEKAHPKIEQNALRNIENVDNLTIDLKGNMLATKSPCHAFLGSMFSNVKHRSKDDSLKDFIIAELSLFCNGLLSTCKGVDVILL